MKHPKILVDAARKARLKACAGFSGYKVGAAVLTAEGRIVIGVNVEVSIYSLTCCAERVALFAALSQGYKKFKALAVSTKDAGSPCGACRQVIWDVCGDIPIYIADAKKMVRETRSSELLPGGFLAKEHQ